MRTMRDTGLASMSFEPGASVPQGVIPLCVPKIVGNEWQYVKECLDTSWVSSVGPFVDRFEETLADYVGVKHGIAMSSGTAALHIALLAAGVRPDDEVLVSNLTFIAPVNAISYAGASPILIDAEPNYWQMDVNRVYDFLTNKCVWKDSVLRNSATGRRIGAILPVHILGHPVDIDPLLEIAERYQLPVIEDATESLGALYRQRKVGHLGAIACFSFNGNKLITTGGGGMVVTDNDEMAARAKYLSTQAKDDPVEYIHGEVGYNYRLTNVQAALGCAQLENIEDFIANKRAIAKRYERDLRSVSGIQTMPHAEWAESVVWLYTILIEPHECGIDSRQLMHGLAAKGIQARPLWQPLTKSPIYSAAQSHSDGVAEILNQKALSLPSSVGLTETEQTSVIEAIHSLCN